MVKQYDGVFYEIELCFKAFRQFLQKNLFRAGLDITVDQWLIMRVIKENQGLKLGEIAELAGKDPASVTRIIELLVKKGYVSKEILPGDRRRAEIQVTEFGAEILKQAKHAAKTCTESALKGIKEKRINKLSGTLKEISGNCG